MIINHFPHCRIHCRTRLSGACVYRWSWQNIMRLITSVCLITRFFTFRNARKKCEYFNSANCARCCLLALFWCALIRLSHMCVCLALAVVAQIKIAHDMQMSNFVQIAQYYSRTFSSITVFLYRSIICAKCVNTSVNIREV